jgi:hypothetical protein
MAQEQHNDKSSGGILMKPLKWLGQLLGPLMLWISFYALMTPLALIMRLLGTDILRLRRDAHAASYWIPRDPPGPRPESMTRQS